MTEHLDINEEYERIFGVESRPSLFSADDEEYKYLRQEIIGAKREFNYKKTLPFEGITLLSYEDFKRNEIVRVAESCGYRIFYIRKYEKSNLIIYAAGYFNAKDSRFVVLKGTFFMSTNYFTSLTSHMSPVVRMKYTSNFNYENGVLNQKDMWTYESASLAASYILGKKSSFREWRDDRGKTLDAYYIKYKSESIDEAEDKTFPNYVAAPTSVIASDKPIDNNKNITETQKTSSPYSVSSKYHLFYINIPGTCNATGYHDEVDNRFVVLKGSTFTKKVELGFDETKLGISRWRFIKAACIDKDSYFEVSEDTKCKSASAAASYLMGNEVSYTSWKDINGKYLKDIFPHMYVQSDESSSQKVNIFESLKKQESQNRVFYIKRDSEIGRECDASGNYDKETGKFILKAGSVLSLDAAPTYKYSVQGIHRKNFFSKFCSKSTKGYVLRSDHVFDSPSAAASYVLGRTANGWQEWRDNNNITLDSVYR